MKNLGLEIDISIDKEISKIVKPIKHMNTSKTHTHAHSLTYLNNNTHALSEFYMY